ncbi:unnamed protein product [Phytomonas sp. EM1]|nr:unnamed protein product [Phytomonas sp. EM1]|eukprot:CCW61352.1 unnamed protein product [Phytomonas sp. isolate EM1]
MYAATHTCQLPCDVVASRLSPNRTKQLVGYGGRDGALYVYPFTGTSPQARLEGLSAPVTSLGFSSNQSSMVGGSSAGGLLMWNLATEQVTRTFKGHRSMITDVEMHTCDYLTASVSTDAILRIWDIRKNVRVQLHNDAKVALHKVQFSPNVKWVATGCANGVVRLYNLGTASLEAFLELRGGAITTLHFHPEMYLMLVGCEDGTVALWNLETFKVLFQSNNAKTRVDCVRFGGTHLLAATEHQLHIWDTRNSSDAIMKNKDAPWGAFVDIAHASFSDEVWFVEANGSTTLTGRFPIGGNWVAEPVPKPNPVSRPQPTAVKEIIPRPLNEASPAPCAITVRAKKQSVNHVVEKPGVALSPPDLPVLPGPLLELPRPLALDCNGSEMEVVDQLLDNGVDTSSMLRRRATHLGVIRSLWQQDPHAALQHLRQLCEEGTEGGVAHDFLITMQQQRMKEKLTVDSVAELLVVLQYALQSPDDSLAVMGLRTLRSVNTKFRARLEEAQRRARVLGGGGSNDPPSSNSESVLKLGQCAMQVLSLTSRQDGIGDEARRIIPELAPPRAH